MEKNERNDLTLKEKIELIDKVESLPPKTSFRRLEEITLVPRSTIDRVLKQKEKLKEEWNLNKENQSSVKRRKREGKNPDVDEALYRWFVAVRERGVQVNGQILRRKAEDLAESLHLNLLMAGYQDGKKDMI
jgi:hypothetical protein